MKDLNKQAINAAADFLFEHNGYASSLEVKMLLRDQGYFALQSEVSAQLWELCQELDWEYDCNGVFRIYRPQNIDEKIIYLLFSAN
jgi:hypothetical protein